MPFLLPWLGLAGAALGLAAEPEEPADPYLAAWYAGATGAPREQRDAAAALLAADPRDLRAHRLYLAGAVQGGGPEFAALAEAYRRWAAADPADPARRLALAYAVAADARPDYLWQTPPSVLPERDGPWCDEVLALTEPLPVEIPLQAAALGLRAEVERRCAREDGATLAQLAALEPVDPPTARKVAWAQARGEVTAAAGAHIAQVAREQPAWIADFLPLWREQAAGEGLEAARAAVLEVARASAAGEDEVLQWSAQRVLRAAEPGGRAPPREPAPPKPLDAALATIDPAERLAALDALSRRERRDSWQRGEWEIARAETLEALSREREALRAWDRAWRASPRDAPNLVFAREAAAQGRRLRAARRAAGVVVFNQGLPDAAIPALAAAERAASQREGLAEAYEVRALVQRARGRTGRARYDAARALALDPTADRHLLLGLLSAEDGDAAAALDHLAAGLALDPDAPLAAEARPVYEELFASHGRFVPGGAAAWLEGVGAVLARSAEPPVKADPGPLVGQPFPDVPLQIGGQPGSLAAIEGPVVVDVWATWCGPCKQSLPDVEQVAREWQGRGVTVVLLSVDAAPEEATSYLGDSLRASVAAWAGPGAMETLGITGIPATFVLDAEHRVVASWVGWGTGGGDPLERALAELIVPAPGLEERR